jgi:ParB-like chromosome segregation protein Spo0J
MRKLSVHPAAEIFPLMRDADFQQLKEDIDLHGLQEPICLYQGQILDGRNRYQACTELGIEPATREYEGDDPEGFVLSVNLHRRHLNASQRAMSAATQATQTWGGVRSKAQNYALSRGRLAKKWLVSERMVDKAAALLKGAEDGTVIRELPKLVWSGDIRLSGAEKISKLPLDGQKAVTQSRNPKRAKGLSSSPERWQRRFETMIAKPRRTADQLSSFLKDADRAEMLMPEPSGRLANEFRDAAKKYLRLAEWLSFKSGVDIAKPVMSAAAAKSE